MTPRASTDGYRKFSQPGEPDFAGRGRDVAMIRSGLSHSSSSGWRVLDWGRSPARFASDPRRRRPIGAARAAGWCCQGCFARPVGSKNSYR